MSGHRTRTVNALKPKAQEPITVAEAPTVYRRCPFCGEALGRIENADLLCRRAERGRRG
jgi:hypothetical protein